MQVFTRDLLFGKHPEIPHGLHTAVLVSTAAFPVGVWVTALCHPTEGGSESYVQTSDPTTPWCPGLHERTHTQLPDALEDTILGTVTKQQLGYPYSLCSLSEAP